MRSRTLFFFAVAVIAFGPGVGCRKHNSKRDAEIEANLDSRMNYFIEMYGSKEKLEKAAGKPFSEIRAECRESIASQLALEEAARKK